MHRTKRNKKENFTETISVKLQFLLKDKCLDRKDHKRKMKIFPAKWPSSDLWVYGLPKAT